jgi:elongation factor 1 alpha-like protein
MEAIDAFEPAKRELEKPFRFIISDVCPEGKHVLVQGRVVQGYIYVGDKCMVMPIGDEAIISRMDHGFLGPRDDNSSLDRSQIALAGDSVNLILGHIDPSRIFPGNLITPLESDPQLCTSNYFQGKLVVMDEISSPIIQGAEVLFHMHNMDIPAFIAKLISCTNRKDGEEIQRPRMLVGGSTALVEIRLNEKICLESFNDCRALGRFALRREGDTIAVGIVERVKV